MKSIVKLLSYCLIVIASLSCKKADVPLGKTAYPIKDKIGVENTNLNLNTTIGNTSQDFTEAISAEQEAKRTKIANWRWADFEPTGFYVPANTTLSINVKQLAGSKLPKLIIGTYYRYLVAQQNNVPSADPPITQLQAGTNTISSGIYGGMIWIRFTTTGTPNSKVKITFNGGQTRHPVYIMNATTTADWNTQLANFNTPDVLLVSNRTYCVYNRASAVSYQNQDNSSVLTTLDRIWNLENDFSGFDNSSAANTPSFHNRILITETDRTSGLAWAYYYGIYFIKPYLSQPFTASVGSSDGWSVWHEMAHEHQQTWTWSTLGEVTNNISALYVQRKLGFTPSRLVSDNTWPSAMSYLAAPNANKDFNSTTNAAINNPFIRLCMFQQLWLAYGDNFFINLHKMARTDSTAFTDDSSRMRWFMLTACSISGKNLTDFFRKWGFLVNESVYTEIANLGFPQPTVEPSTLSE